jgi:hypothetical protein
MHNEKLAVEWNVNVGKEVLNSGEILVQEQQPSRARQTLL